MTANEKDTLGRLAAFTAGLAIASFSLVGAGFYFDLTNTQKANLLEKQLADAISRESETAANLQLISQSKSELKTNLESEISRRVAIERSREDDLLPLKAKIYELEKANMELNAAKTPFSQVARLTFVDSSLKYDTQLLKNLGELTQKAKQQFDDLSLDKTLTELQVRDKSDAIRQSVGNKLRGVEVTLPFQIAEIKLFQSQADNSLVQLTLKRHPQNKTVAIDDFQASVDKLLASKLYRDSNVGVTGYIVDKPDAKEYAKSVPIRLLCDGSQIITKFIVVSQVECYAKDITQ